ncbi:hypothetical protein COL68_11495 [Bacillus wiedmannii]|uniref:Uncharacterized protein n=1 Tax=Bacillus wiedmannii TaxID=1890302 RepID=A0A2B5PPH2_9BACI|nr:hypothetical protein TU65_02130 [Bacillus wiedmannii]PEI66546.1 hypothetical protein CN646_21490 [Bacillus wiedmannii]PEJ52518.1 hypothetical protein CN672_03225 [Bacillus wiedmannii]PEJ73882.1 hypothetical protein CN888_12060 [Bacillus wiedmannii]PEL19757.1 hypothetical protein CN599_07375 [Bacillus wiedmannii]
MFSCNTKIYEGKLRKVTNNYFNPKLFSKSISLRVDSPKNNQEKKVNFASNYREIP